MSNELSQFFINLSEETLLEQVGHWLPSDTERQWIEDSLQHYQKHCWFTSSWESDNYWVTPVYTEVFYILIAICSLIEWSKK